MFAGPVLYFIRFLLNATVLVTDMGFDDVVSEGISGVHCAVGPANQVRENTHPYSALELRSCF